MLHVVSFSRANSLILDAICNSQKIKGEPRAHRATNPARMAYRALGIGVGERPRG